MRRMTRPPSHPSSPPEPTHRSERHQHDAPHPRGTARPHPPLHRRRVRRLGRRRDVRRARPGVERDLRAGRGRPEGRHRPRRRRRPSRVHRRPVAAHAAARALARAAPDRRHRRVPRRAARRAGDVRHRPADHAGARPGAARRRELPVLRRPDRRAGRRHLQGARPPDQLRQPQADRRRRAHHAVEHAVHARVVEARPGARHRQHGRAEAGRVHAAVGVAVGGDLRGGRAARRACSTSSTGSARRRATRW